MIGVGAAFDFLAGRKKQAPKWMQRFGLEWLFRLAHEPRRLFRRYVYHNPRFVALAFLQWMKAGSRVHQGQRQTTSVDSYAEDGITAHSYVRRRRIGES
jgi:hypothetical protein